MKHKHVIPALTVIGLFSAGCARTTEAAKFTKAQAEAIALQRSNGGAVKSSELEQERGKLVWSFDIAKLGTKDLTEVLVDARTGEVISVDVETPAEEATEAIKEVAERRR